jgi:hypothetical protein
VTIFRTLFSREIGLKSFGEEGDSVFGMSVIRDELMLSIEIFPSKKSWIS